MCKKFKSNSFSGYYNVGNPEENVNVSQDLNMAYYYRKAKICEYDAIMTITKQEFILDGKKYKDLTDRISCRDKNNAIIGFIQFSGIQDLDNLEPIDPGNLVAPQSPTVETYTVSAADGIFEDVKHVIIKYIDNSPLYTRKLYFCYE